MPVSSTKRFGGDAGLTVTVPVPAVPTVRISAGVALVSVPLVPCIVKLYVAAVALPRVTVKGAPAADATGIGGVKTHVVGAPLEQLSVTPPR